MLLSDNNLREVLKQRCGAAWSVSQCVFRYLICIGSALITGEVKPWQCDFIHTIITAETAGGHCVHGNQYSVLKNVSSLCSVHPVMYIEPEKLHSTQLTL